MQTKVCLLLMLCMAGLHLSVLAQQQVSGVVIGENNNPVPYASVRISGTNRGTTTDENGNFILNVKSGDTLLITSLGYKQQKFPVQDNTRNIRIVLSSTARGLNEVVVTGLGVKREEKKLGYAVSQVSGEDVQRANVVDPTTALQGKVAGVFINTGTGGPTSSNRIIIRGNTSLDPNNQPLIVVDGVIVDDQPTGAGQWGSSQDFGNQLKDINPDDIASISVLKGAAASAQWGSRATHGVILITTKKGRSDKKIGVTVTHTEQWSQVFKFPDYQNEYGAGWTFGLDSFVTDPNTNRPQIDPSWGYWSFGPRMNGQTVEDMDGHIQKFSPNNPKDAYQTGRFVNTNIAIDGGNEQTTFRLSFSNQHNLGIAYGNTFTRNNINLNATQKLGKIVDINANVNFTRSDAMNPARDGGNDNLLFMMSYAVPRTYDINYYKTHFIDSVNGGRNKVDDNYYGLTGYWFNLYKNNAEQKEDNLRSSLEMTVHATPWLDFHLNGYANNFYTTYTNKQLGQDANFSGGYYEINKGTHDNYRLVGQAELHRAFRNWDADLILGTETYSDKLQSVDARTDGGLIIPGKFTLSNSVNRSLSSESYSNYKLNSAYAFLTIGWNSQLYLDLTARNDWSSALTYPDGHGNNSYLYPSASASWIFSQTFHLPGYITFAKFRASYAQVGRDISPYFSSSGLTYHFSQNYQTYQGNNIPIYEFNSNNLGNLNIKPEIMSAVELGLNMQFLQNRIGFDVSYYKDNTKNQVLSLQVAQETGVANRTINAGNIQNAGVELLITAKPVESRNFTWSLSVNYTHNENKIISLAPGVNLYVLEYGQGVDVESVAIPGQEYGTIYTKYDYAKYQALDDKGNPVADPNNGKKVLYPTTDYLGNPAARFRRTNDYQGQGYVKIGSSQPKFYYGFMNDFQYKNFTLHIALDGRVGGNIVSATYDYGYAFGNWKTTLFGRDKAHGGLERKTFDQAGNVTGVYYDGIIPDGVFQQGSKVTDPLGVQHDVTGMSYQEVVDKGWIQPVSALYYYYSLGSWAAGIRTTGLAKNDWLALREISIGYQLPSYLANKLKLNSLRLILVGRNLGYLINKLPAHINPEGLYNSNAGNAFEYGGLPFVRNFGFTIQAGL